MWQYIVETLFDQKFCSCYGQKTYFEDIFVLAFVTILQEVCLNLSIYISENVPRNMT